MLGSHEPLVPGRSWASRPEEVAESERAQGDLSCLEMVLTLTFNCPRPSTEIPKP